jgi:hypothetical protein
MLSLVVTLFELGPRAQEIVDGLKDVLGGVLFLIDDHLKTVHAARPTGWLSFTANNRDVGRNRCHAEARILDRWTLLIVARKGQTLHPDAQLLVDWAAVKMAPYLPERPAIDDLPFPPTGGGSPSGSAEIGIPVWWARRTRS